ncbi:MAG: hypothetical protein ACLT0Y_00750 [Christensenellales bacterium]
MGLGANLLFIGIGLLISRKDRETQAFYMLNCSGYNIGAFTMPFVQNFLGTFSMVITCLFDMGNAVMCTGGTFALTGLRQNGENESHGKKHCQNVVFLRPV